MKIFYFILAILAIGLTFVIYICESRMAKRIVFFLVGFILASCVLCGCASQSQMMIISQPAGPRVVFVEPEKPFVVGESDSLIAESGLPNTAPGADEILSKPFTEFRPDPCKGMIKNYSSQIVISVWLNKIPSEDPTFKLLPQQVMTVYAPVGPLKIYAEAVQKTAYGWRKVGSHSREQIVSAYAWNANDFNWRCYLNDYDFPGMR